VLTIIMLILGVFFGGLAEGAGGAVIGGVLGYLLARVWALGESVANVERRLMDAESRRSETAPAAAPVAIEPVTPVVPVAASAEAPPEAALDDPFESMADETPAPPPAQPWKQDASPWRREIEQAQAAEKAQSAAPASSDSSIIDDGWLSNAGSWLREYFSGESALARIGMVILFIGLAFGAKFAAEQGYFPIEFRLAMIGLGGIALTALGWWLRERNRQYSLTLQGGGMAVLYLTLFAAAKLYHLMPLATALFGMLILVGITVALAIKQDARVLASGATIGGFMAPILASSGSGDHVLLFSYFLILDLGVLAIAWWRRWRELNLIGWVGTYGLGTTWGVLSYQPELFASTEPFLIAFFLVFLAAAVFGTLRPPPKLRGFVDGSLIFGTPIATFLLQRELLLDDSTGLAWSAAAMAALYAAAAWITFRRKDDKLDLLARSFSVLALAFITLAIPYALTDQGTAAAWALEGVTVAWLGARQDRRIGRGLGVLMQIAAGGALIWQGVPATLDSFSLGDRVTELILSISALITALFLTQWEQADEDRELDLPAGIPLLLGWFWWGWLGLREIERVFDGWDAVVVALMFFAATALVLRLAATRLRWPQVAAPDRLVIPMFGAALLYRLASDGWLASPMDDLGLIGIPLTVAGSIAVIRFSDWEDNVSVAQQAMLLIFAMFAAWFATHAGLVEADISRGNWDAATTALIFAIATAALLQQLARRLDAPSVATADLFIIPLLATTLVFRLFTAGLDGSPLDGLGMVILPLAFVGCLAILRYEIWEDGTSSVQHVLLVLTLVFTAWFSTYALMADNQVAHSWRNLTVGLFALIPALLMMRFADRLPWPIAAQAHAYRVRASGILLIVAALWASIMTDNPGPLAGVPYWPLLNPYDLTQAAALFGVGWWLLRRHRESDANSSALKPIAGGLAVAALTWISMVVARTVHAFADVSYSVRALHHSLVFQTSISVTWTLLAAATVILGTRRGSRIIWLGGAALFGLTVVKLFLVDLADTGTMQRIISFIAVGGVMLAAGYLAPLPPAKGEDE
jgi:uncharacterized membrane protein